MKNNCHLTTYCSHPSFLINSLLRYNWRGSLSGALESITFLNSSCTSCSISTVAWGLACWHPKQWVQWVQQAGKTTEPILDSTLSSFLVQHIYILPVCILPVSVKDTEWAVKASGYPFTLRECSGFSDKVHYASFTVIHMQAVSLIRNEVLKPYSLRHNLFSHAKRPENPVLTTLVQWSWEDLQNRVWNWNLGTCILSLLLLPAQQEKQQNSFAVHSFLPDPTLFCRVGLAVEKPAERSSTYHCFTTRSPT